jgi:hypothetical protein
MNFTIWAEVIAAALVLIDLTSLAIRNVKLGSRAAARQIHH